MLLPGGGCKKSYRARQQVKAKNTARGCLKKNSTAKKSGGIPGYYTFIGMNPAEDKAVVVLTNRYGELEADKNSQAGRSFLAETPPQIGSPNWQWLRTHRAWHHVRPCYRAVGIGGCQYNSIIPQSTVARPKEHDRHRCVHLLWR